MNWTTHFGLVEAPFSKEIEDDALWVPTSKVPHVDRIVEAVRNRETGFLLVGEPGVGKTCLLRLVRHRLADTSIRLTYCHNATLGRRDFYRQLCHALGLTPKATAAGVFYALTTHVEELSRERVHPVFLLDEAQLLNQDVLDHLHILTNYGWDSRALLTLGLVGLPELWDRMLLRRNRALWSRIHCRINLGEAQPADTVEYIRHRLTVAGAPAELFASDGLALLHEGTAGRLRDVDRVATGCLRLAAQGGHRIVDRAIVTQILTADQAR
jgi:general secretion pathway protein A